MVACSGYLTLVVIAGVVVAAVGVGISSVGEGMVAIESVVELGLSLSLTLEDVAIGSGVGVVRVAVVVEAVGHGVVDTAVVDESGVSLGLALGNVDSAGALGMVHALASIAHGLYGVIGVGLGLNVHRLVVGDRLEGSSIRDGLVGSGVGGVLVVGHGRVEVRGVGLRLALAEAVVDVVVAVREGGAIAEAAVGGGVRVVEPEVLRVGSDSQEEL